MCNENQQPVPLPAKYCEFFLDTDLLSLGARLLSLSIVRDPKDPMSPAFIRMRLSIPTKKQVLANHADPDAMGFPAYETMTCIQNIMGVKTCMESVGDESVEIDYEHDSGGKIPNTPAHLVNPRK